MKDQHTVGHRIRVAALEHHIPYVTNLLTFRATVAAMRSLRSGGLQIRALNELAAHSLEV